MSERNIVEVADAFIADLFASWNVLSIILTLILFSAVLYPLLTGQDPDVHPFLLARQSQAAPIRNPGETAVLRAVDIPHGYPLRAGLGVKDPGAPKWSAGRNGDLRDVWRQAVRGPVKEDGSLDGPKGKILTVLGREKIVEHDLDELTGEINAIGQHVKDKGGKLVAVSLSNSTELLCSIFAFYNFSVVLFPFGLPEERLGALLAESNADILIAEAGTLDLDAVKSATKKIRQLIWVVKEGSKHIDWTENARGISAATWHDLVAESTTGREVPTLDKEAKAEPLSIFCPTSNDNFELVEFTSENLIAGTAALNATLARTYKISASDTLLSTTPLSDSYTLTFTFAALFSNATIALNSVAGPTVSLPLALATLTPTILIASPSTILEYNQTLTSRPLSLPTRLSHYFARRTLAEGCLPSSRPSLSSPPSLSKLRLLLIPQSSFTPKISSATLASLRLHLHARVALALTAPRVAGAVCQSNILDYRDKGEVVSVGPPVGSVELLLKGDEDEIVRSGGGAGGGFRGQIVVRGPAVSLKAAKEGEGKVVLEDIRGMAGDDYTVLLG